MNDFYPLEYLSVLMRRKFLFSAVFGTLLIAALVFALQWSKYRAYAKVEVAPPEISLDAIESPEKRILTAEAMADLQISRLRQKVLSPSSLVYIIAKLNLYPEARAHKPIAYIARDMAKKINIHLESTALANPASAQKATALQLSAIAFTLSFEYPDPLLAQKTVNELVTLFLDEDMKERRETAEKTSAFLQGQIDILSRSLEEQEQKIAEFQAAHGGIRPDALIFNQQASVTISSRLLAIESDLISNLGLIGALRAQLAQTDPYSSVLDETGGVLLTSPAIQLRALKSQYATLSAKYGAAHPDVLKVSRQISALEGQITPMNLSALLKAKMADTRTNLARAEKAYGTAHPDYVSLKNQLENLQDQLEEAEEGAGGTIMNDADNPAYLQIVAQIKAAEKQQEALKSQRDEVKRQQEEYRQAVADSPAAEKQMATLSRDYDNMMLLYRDLKARKLEADMSRTIEEGHAGRRLAVIDPPELPRGTTPSRKLIFAAGFIFALMAGLGSVIALQLLSQTVMGPHHLQSLIGAAPLVIVPRIYSIDDKLRRRRLGAALLVAAPFLITALLILFFMTVMPFDVFEALVERKAGL